MRQCVKCGEVKPLEAFELTEKWRRRKCAVCRSGEARAWNLAHPERVKVSKKAHYERYRERFIAKQGEWYRANKDRHREYQLRHREANRERYREQALRWYYNNREKAFAWVKQYRVENPEKYRQHSRAANAARSARRREAQGSATSQQVQARWDYYGGRCWMCGTDATDIDHVVPLARGGSNWPANLRPACGSCNGRKHAKLPSELVS